MLAISKATAGHLAQNPVYAWYARVPSPSNIADGTSRGERAVAAPQLLEAQVTRTLPHVVELRPDLVLQRLVQVVARDDGQLSLVVLADEGVAGLAALRAAADRWRDL